MFGDFHVNFVIPLSLSLFSFPGTSLLLFIIIVSPPPHPLIPAVGGQKSGWSSGWSSGYYQSTLACTSYLNQFSRNCIITEQTLPKSTFLDKCMRNPVKIKHLTAVCKQQFSFTTLLSYKGLDLWNKKNESSVIYMR